MPSSFSFIYYYVFFIFFFFFCFSPLNRFLWPLNPYPHSYPPCSLLPAHLCNDNGKYFYCISSRFTFYFLFLFFCLLYLFPAIARAFSRCFTASISIFEPKGRWPKGGEQEGEGWQAAGGGCQQPGRNPFCHFWTWPFLACQRHTLAHTELYKQLIFIWYSNDFLGIQELGFVERWYRYFGKIYVHIFTCEI